MMIWNVCARVANGRSFSDEIKGDVAMKAWVETVAIEEALNEHDCDGEKGLMYQVGRKLPSPRVPSSDIQLNS